MGWLKAIGHLFRPERIAYEFRRLLHSPAALVGGGVVLVAVPTVFTVFPQFADWASLWRWLIVGVWLVVAATIVRASVRQGSQMEKLVGRTLERRQRQRFFAGSRILQALLWSSATGFPKHYEFRVFLFDESVGKLISSFHPEGVDVGDGWEPGLGAVGAAWQSGEYVAVHGEACHDDTWGLTPEEQEQYASLAVVAAMPVRNARWELIAILAGSSERDDGQLTGPEGLEKHRLLAEVVARVLVDILTESLGTED